MLRSGLADLVDIELLAGGPRMAAFRRLAAQTGTKLLLSSHDFHATPTKVELLARLRSMEDLGADVSKVAVMPRSARDVLTLLETTLVRSREARGPVVTVAMGPLGAVSRLAGETFGSAMTFGAADKASAPGQLNVDLLRQALDALHGEK